MFDQHFSYAESDLRRPSRTFLFGVCCHRLGTSNFDVWDPTRTISGARDDGIRGQTRPGGFALNGFHPYPSRPLRLPSLFYQ